MKKNYTIMTIILAGLIITSCTIKSHETFNDEKKMLYHKIIAIQGDNDFTKKNGVISGSGTKENPYIISNWKINSVLDTGIKIKNTNAYFVIQNCSINSRISKLNSCLFLTNVSNAKILNCDFSQSYFGLAIISSSNNIVENCTFNSCINGLTLNGCPTGNTPKSLNNIAKNCIFTNCSNGIYFCCLPSSSNNLIESCVFYKNEVGILFDHLSNYIIITGCNFSNNNIGLEVHSTSSNNHISNNIFWKNSLHAIDNCTNFWDNEQKYGGNYWEGFDSKYSYNISGIGENKDFYPKNNSSFVNQLIAYFKTDKIIYTTAEDIEFDGALSYDDSTSNYVWDFGDETTKIGAVANHTYQNSGIYNVTLEVSNGILNDTFTKKIEVITLSNNTIYVPSNTSIQSAIDYAKPGNFIIVENGTYAENIVIEKPYIGLIGSGPKTIIDGEEKGDVIKINAPFVNISNFKISNSSENAAGIRIGKSNYLIDNAYCCINNNILTDNWIGIELAACENIKISENDFFDNYYGVFTNKSHQNLFELNNFSSNRYGLYLLWGSNWNLIQKNIFSNNEYCGIKINWSHYNNILFNEICNNKNGVNIYKGLSNKINYNNIYSNYENGIYFFESIGVKNFKHNWWGSRFGPSGFLNLRGDKITGLNQNGVIITTLPIQKLLFCHPWEKQKIDFNDS